jgi:hypothetical protein
MSFSDGNWLRHFFKQFEGDITQHPTYEKGDSWKLRRVEIVGNWEI